MITRSAPWEALTQHYERIKHSHIRDFFKADPQRFNHLSLSAAGLTLDYSKNHITNDTLNALNDLARFAQVEQQRDRMFAGEAINVTEQRAVLHTALRNFSEQPVFVDGKNIMPDIKATLDKVKSFVEAISQGTKRGYTGKVFTDVVSLGIGGSFLGPKLMSEALKPYRQKKINVHFVANIDGCHLHDVLAGLNPETTLVIVSSKSFSTQETLMNAKAARAWMLESAEFSDLQHNFACVSANIAAATTFGIAEENIFPMWDWVGGRYSVWSAIGLPLAIAIGFDHYLAFLQGAAEMDEHFQQAPLAQNMPVIMALVGIWYRNFFDAQSHALLPYYHYLRGLPAYVQQLDMESNGKSVSVNNEPLSYQTGPIIWGSEGANSQHSFHQLMHQGNTLTPIDFMVPLRPFHDVAEHHHMLVANCFGQSQALMDGQTEAQVRASMKQANCSDEEIKRLLNHRVMKGDNPSNTIVFDTLDPKTLGSLIALYEHKTFVQGVVWQINSFDQWGVELGKVLGNKVLGRLTNVDEPLTMDSSTNGLIELYRNR